MYDGDTLMNSSYESIVTPGSMKGLCNEEEKSLKVMKTSLKKLEDRQEYITAFLHKVLNTEGQCVLRHKMQVRFFFFFAPLNSFSAS